VAKETPLVTIGIPTYNRDTHLSKAIESALKQTYFHLEILVIDNCSDDNTSDVVKKFNDKRLHYVRNDRNLGMTANFNRVLELFHGDYVNLLCDDDYLLPGFVKACLDVFRRNPTLGLVVSPAIVCDPSGNELWRYFIPGPEYLIPKQMWKRLVYMQNEIGMPSGVMLSREAVKATGYFNDSFPYLSDYDYWIRVFTNFPIGYIQRHLAVTVRHDRQNSAIGFYNHALIIRLKSIAKALDTPGCPLSRKEKLLCKLKEGEVFFWGVIKHFLNGRFREAKRILNDLAYYVPIAAQAIYCVIHFPVYACRGLRRRLMVWIGKPFVMHRR